MARPIVEKRTQFLIRIRAAHTSGQMLPKKFPAVPVQEFEMRLGRETLRVQEGRVITGMVNDTEGRAYLFSAILFPVRDSGEENGRRIDILFGSIILEDWGTVIDDSVTPPKVDYKILREGALTELHERLTGMTGIG